MDDSGNLIPYAIIPRRDELDIRYRFVQEFVLDGFLKIIFVRTKMNDADIFTNNLGGDLYYCHSRKMITEKGKKLKQQAFHMEGC